MWSSLLPVTKAKKVGNKMIEENKLQPEVLVLSKTEKRERKKKSKPWPLSKYNMKQAVDVRRPWTITEMKLLFIEERAWIPPKWIAQRPCHLLGGFPQGPRPRGDMSFMDESQADPLLQSCGWSVWRSCDLHCSVTGDGIEYFGVGGSTWVGNWGVAAKCKDGMGLLIYIEITVYRQHLHSVVLEKLPNKLLIFWLMWACLWPPRYCVALAAAVVADALAIQSNCTLCVSHSDDGWPLWTIHP